jgi:hypothetical protein
MTPFGSPVSVAVRRCLFARSTLVDELRGDFDLDWSVLGTVLLVSLSILTISLVNQG